MPKEVKPPVEATQTAAQINSQSLGNVTATLATEKEYTGMVQADCMVSMSKNHTVVLKGVTPIEALLLVAEHHRQVGGCPVELLTKPVPTRVVKTTTHIVKQDRKMTGKDAEGKEVDVMVSVDVPVVVEEVVEKDRTEDQEGDRLRQKYGAKKVDALFSKIRNLPKTFDEALSKGISVNLPTNGMIEGQIASTAL